MSPTSCNISLVSFGGKGAEEAFSKITSRNNLLPKLVILRKYTI